MDFSSFGEVVLKVFGINVIRYIIMAGIPFLIFYVLFINSVNRHKIQKRKAIYKDFFREIKNSTVMMITVAVISYLVLFTPFVNYTQVYYDSSLYPSWWFPLSIVLALIIHDTYFYWMHRLIHHPRLFKAIHLPHHKSVNPSPFASYSFGLIESVLENGILIVMILAIPMHIDAIMVFGIIAFLINVYGHLGFEIAPRWYRHTFLFEIVNSSVHHNLHHSKFNGNYGLYFRVWDRIMGTENPNYVAEYDKIQEQRFGVSVKLEPELK